MSFLKKHVGAFYEKINIYIRDFANLSINIC